MGGIGGAIIGGNAQIVGGMISQAASAKASKRAREWQHDERLEAQSWMTEMSNTAYQRSMADMKLAGLNPILAYGGSGASSPQSSAGSTQAAQQPDFSKVADAMAAGVSSGVAMKRAAMEKKQIAENINSMKEDQALKFSLQATEASKRDYLAQQTSALAVKQQHDEATLPAAEARGEQDASKEGQFMLRIERFLNVIGSGLGNFGTFGRRNTGRKSGIVKIHKPKHPVHFDRK